MKYIVEKNLKNTDCDDSTSEVYLRNLNECETGEDFEKSILYYCQDINKKWSKAFKQLMDNNEKTMAKTIRKGIITDIFLISDPVKRKEFVDRELGKEQFGDKRKTVYELYFADGSMENFELNNMVLERIGLANCNDFGNFTRGTIIGWRKGERMPKDRDCVIKLAFFAKCTIAETNKLLECAGMHKLYVKGTGKMSGSRSSLRDLVYIYMLNNRNYSFAAAQEKIRELDHYFQKKLKQEEAFQRPDDSTPYLEDELLTSVFEDDKLMQYFKEYLPGLIYSYTALYGNLVELFREKYRVSKSIGKSDGSYDSIRGLTLSNSLSNFGKGWRDSLSRTIYAAYRVDDPKNLKAVSKRKLERSFNRNDIIVLGLILNSSMAEINNLLDLAKEPPLYSKNFIESVIINAAKYNRIYSKSDDSSELAEKLYTEEVGSYYGVSEEILKEVLSIYRHFYHECVLTGGCQEEYKKFKPGICALMALERYEWIRHISVVREYSPEKTKKLKAVIRGLKNLESENIVIKGEQIMCVRPIAYRYSRELLHWFPEKALFEFLLKKTADYLCEGEKDGLSMYLRRW